MKHTTKTTFLGYIYALGVTLYIFTLLTIYYLAADKIGGVHYIQNIFANTTLTLLSIILMMGPVARMHSRVAWILVYRKKMGIFALITGVIHTGTITTITYPSLLHYTIYPLGSLFGSVGFCILMFLYLISRPAVHARLGSKRWWELQYKGVRAAYLILIVHIMSIRFYQWNYWFAANTASFFPPLSLVLTIISMYIVIVRIAEYTCRHHIKTILLIQTLIFLGVITGLLFTRLG